MYQTAAKTTSVMKGLDRRPAVSADRRPIVSADRRPVVSADRRPAVSAGRRPAVSARPGAALGRKPLDLSLDLQPRSLELRLWEEGGATEAHAALLCDGCRDGLEQRVEGAVATDWSSNHRESRGRGELTATLLVYTREAVSSGNRLKRSLA